MPDNTFDVVSEVEMPEVANAIQQAAKEIAQRFDLKDSKSVIELDEKEKKIVLRSLNDFKLKAVAAILEAKLVKRKVPLKALNPGPIEPAAGSTVRQEIALQVGIPTEYMLLGSQVEPMTDDQLADAAEQRGGAWIPEIRGRVGRSNQEAFALTRAPQTNGPSDIGCQR